MTNRCAALYVGVVALAVGACGPSAPGVDAGLDAATSCPNDLPAACPAPPSFTTRIDPIIQARCLPCHGPGGVSASRPLDTYDQIYGLRTTVLTQVYGCLMPPPDAGPLAPSDRAALLQWLVCHAPDN